MSRKPSFNNLDDGWMSVAPTSLKKLIQFALKRKKIESTQESYSYLFPGFYWHGSILKLSGLEPYGSGRYSMTPPELFPFASLGDDGVHYGCVVHAPELDENDPPIGIFDPTGLVEGVKLLGHNFEHALERLLSEALAADDPESIDAIASLLNVHPSLDKRNSSYMAYDEVILPKIPPGWHFEPSSDGIGVLAPRDAFIENSPTCKSWSFDIVEGKGYPILQDVDAALQFVEELLSINTPGSALFVLRELYWLDRGDRVFLQSKDLWKDAYFQLQRPLLSNVVEEEAKFRQKLIEASQELQESGEECITEIWLEQ